MCPNRPINLKLDEVVFPDVGPSCLNFTKYAQEVFPDAARGQHLPHHSYRSATIEDFAVLGLYDVRPTSIFPLPARVMKE